jgi:hypothetical protein
MPFVDFCITHFDWTNRQTNMCRNQSNSISCVAVSVHESGQGLSTKELNVYRIWVWEDGHTAPNVHLIESRQLWNVRFMCVTSHIWLAAKDFIIGSCIDQSAIGYHNCVHVWVWNLEGFDMAHKAAYCLRDVCSVSRNYIINRRNQARSSALDMYS